MKFLSAEWKNLLLANYRVDAGLLQPYVPRGTLLDAWDGRVFVSLVAFLFDRTRVLGIPPPLHQRFEEVNLRFYVKPQYDPSIRGVTFLKEIVPSRVIPPIANTLFHEAYVAAPMDHGAQPPVYWYSWGRGQTNRFQATIGERLDYPAAGSLTEFITEHYWGYTQGPRHTLEYHVTHPTWRVSEATDFHLAVDFASTYGQEFGFLATQTPTSVLYAEGSRVAVSFPRRMPHEAAGATSG